MKGDPKKLYEPLDRFQESIRKVIKKGFAELELAGFDRLNVIRAREAVERLYKKVDKKARKAFEDIMWLTVLWCYEQTGDTPEKSDWEGFVEDFLGGYNRVTGYVYDTELDRKATRLIEAMLTAKEFKDAEMFRKELRRAANLLYTQVSEYALDILSAAELAAFDEIAETVQFHTQRDGIVCGDCNENEGKIFSVSKAPRIPMHYHCRCYYTVGPKLAMPVGG